MSTANDAHVTPAEWMLAVRSAPTQDGDFVVTAGGGTGIPIGAESVTRLRVRALLTLRMRRAASTTATESSIATTAAWGKLA
ncbi:MAG: hypothetical protein U0235_19555 [Polyangiaceae bacterium]